MEEALKEATKQAVEVATETKDEIKGLISKSADNAASAAGNAVSAAGEATAELKSMVLKSSEKPTVDFSTSEDVASGAANEIEGFLSDSDNFKKIVIGVVILGGAVVAGIYLYQILNDKKGKGKPKKALPRGHCVPETPVTYPYRLTNTTPSPNRRSKTRSISPPSPNPKKEGRCEDDRVGRGYVSKEKKRLEELRLQRKPFVFN